MNKKLLLVAGKNSYGDVVWEGIADIRYDYIFDAPIYTVGSKERNQLGGFVAVAMINRGAVSISLSGAQYPVCTVNGVVFKESSYQEFIDFVLANNGSEAYLVIYSG